jgi:hypothetical protein
VSTPITIICTIPFNWLTPMKRIPGGQTSVGADAKLLSSHAGDPRAATGDRTKNSQARPTDQVEHGGLESARRRPEELPLGSDVTGP